jgi:hypothetical protein
MIRSAVLLAAAGLFGAGVLSGCGAGQSTQTESQQAPVSGVNVGSADGTIQLRDLAIVYKDPEGYRKGGTAALRVRIFNQGTTPVRLTGVETSAGQAVVSGPSAMPSVSPTPSTSPAPSGSASASASASGSVSASGAPSASASAPSASSASASASASAPVGNPRVDIEIPVAGFVVLEPSSSRYLQLTDLPEDLRPGRIIQVTFRFDNGTTITTPLSTSVPLSELPRSPMEFDEEH